MTHRCCLYRRPLNVNNTCLLKSSHGFHKMFLKQKKMKKSWNISKKMKKKFWRWKNIGKRSYDIITALKNWISRQEQYQDQQTNDKDRAQSSRSKIAVLINKTFENSRLKAKNFAKILSSLKQFIQKVKGYNNQLLVTEGLFNFFLEVSQIYKKVTQRFIFRWNLTTHNIHPW